jgi:hypothetical protein
MRYWPLPRQAASKPTAPGARLRSAQETRPTDISCRSTPGKSTGREIVERVAEAALGSVPLVGAALAGTLVTALGWRLEDGLSLESLAGNDLCTDAVVMATRTVEHTHQAEKIQALRNAVLNSVAPGAPDADSQAIMHPGRLVHALASAPGYAVGRPARLVRLPRPAAAGSGHDHKPDGDGGSRAARDARPEGLLPAHRR